MTENYIRNVVEAALLAAGRPLQLTELAQLFEESSRPEPADLRAALDALQADYGSRGIEVKETATGFRIQVKRELANEVSRLWPERPPRYSRALLETLALIAYRQPITRAEIEAVRGVAVNPNIIKTVIERGWVRVVGTRDVPGRPELLGTTKEFLDYFGLRSLEELPPLAELKAMGEINLQLDLAKPAEPGAEGGGSQGSGGTEGAGGDGGAAPADANGAAGSAADAAAAAPAAVAASESAEGGTEQATEASSEPTESASDSTGAAAPSAEGAADSVSADSPSDAVVVEVAQAEAPPAAEESQDAVAAEAEQASSNDAADSGEVTVEVETLGLVEAQIEASIESDSVEASVEPGEIEAASAPDELEASVEVAEVAPRDDSAIETGQFELAELGMGTPAQASVLEAEFDAEDLEAEASDDDGASEEESSDDEEELSAGPQSSTELVASPPRDRDD